MLLASINIIQIHIYVFSPVTLLLYHFIYKLFRTNQTSTDKIVMLSGRLVYRAIDT